ncbi:hypothetical protein PENANT_c030G08623 [Penicillium antarcticum]|uniref:Uncharacterized protein n=1 Tax=Penicillium antarcticum TaxID=416450 RepID=A0A1V6PX82_9EURO|nr:hypothetical protein PENANT_c030G08623 [Penicillium antarcticum]
MANLGADGSILAEIKADDASLKHDSGYSST